MNVGKIIRTQFRFVWKMVAVRHACCVHWNRPENQIQRQISGENSQKIHKDAMGSPWRKLQPVKPNWPFTQFESDPMIAMFTVQWIRGLFYGIFEVQHLACQQQFQCNKFFIVNFCHERGSSFSFSPCKTEHRKYFSTEYHRNTSVEKKNGIVVFWFHMYVNIVITINFRKES